MIRFLPDPDPIPLPAPAALFKFLLGLTFTIHILLVSLVIGGGLIAYLAVSRRRAANLHARAFARAFLGAVPVLLAFAITFGVAPLLFVQVLYGQFFYSATVLMAWPWLSVFAVIIAAYYLFYARALGKTGAAAGLLAVVLLLWVAFMYVNMSTLSLTPRRWWPMWQASQAGMALNLAEPTLLPRLLHVLIAAVAVAGIAIAAYGALAQKATPEYGQWVKARGASWFIAATLVQIPVGLWLLLSLPQHVSGQFLGGSVVRTVHLFAAAAAAILVLPVVTAASRRPARGIILLCSAVMALVVAIMVVVRQWVRDAYLGEFLQPARVQPQTAAVLLFFALFALGLAVIAWMLLKAARRR